MRDGEPRGETLLDTTLNYFGRYPEAIRNVVNNTGRTFHGEKMIQTIISEVEGGVGSPPLNFSNNGKKKRRGRAEWGRECRAASGH